MSKSDQNLFKHLSGHLRSHGLTVEQVDTDLAPKPIINIVKTAPCFLNYVGMIIVHPNNKLGVYFAWYVNKQTRKIIQEAIDSFPIPTQKETP